MKVSAAFYDSPVYATGYTTLLNIPGTVAETHMLNLQDRVKTTYEYADTPSNLDGKLLRYF